MLDGIKLNLNHCEFGFKKEQHDDTSRNWFISQEICREWASGKLVKYESLRVSNGRVESGRVGSKMVKLRVDMRVHTEKFQFFNVKYHAIIEIVECESGRVAKKLSIASRLCEYAGTRPFPSSHEFFLNPTIKKKQGLK